jgi:predicted flap endonuclease-1-like 5' DNA nuclease
MSYPLMDIDGIDDHVARTLKRVGIRTTTGLLEAAKDAKGRKALAARTGLNEKLLLEWANVADRMRIKGIGEEYAALLRAAGVDTVRELKHRNALKLARAMQAANDKRRLVKFLPSEKHVTKWIEQAKRLPLKISY